MKRFISIVLVIAFIFTSAIIANAADGMIDDSYALYEEYVEIITEANEAYGCSLSILPYNEIEYFCSTEEFRSIVSGYCEIRASEFSSTNQASVDCSNTRAVGVVTVPNVKTKTYSEDTITVTFYGTFDVRKNLDGDYYIYSKSFVVNTKSANGIISFTVSGNPTISLADGGRTTTVTQNFSIIIRGYFEDYVSVSASYYMSPATGNVSALTN